MTPDQFGATLSEIKQSIQSLSAKVGSMSDEAIAARGEHREMDRKLEDHEELLHGKDNIPLRVDRLEQKVVLAKWGLHIAGAMGGALAMLALEHFFK